MSMKIQLSKNDILYIDGKAMGKVKALSYGGLVTFDDDSQFQLLPKGLYLKEHIMKWKGKE